MSENQKTRLEVLQASLEKKSKVFDRKMDDYIADVKSANGQPLNDKRNGRQTLDRWSRKDMALHNQNKEIEKTAQAIEREEGLILEVERARGNLPQAILDLVDSGVLQQWRKHPTTFFVAGVDKARLYWDVKKKILSHKYVRSIVDADQWKEFAKVYNALKTELNLKDQ